MSPRENPDLLREFEVRALRLHRAGADRRPFVCQCGYQGWEYWNMGRRNMLICTKCGNGRIASPDNLTGGAT